MKLKIEIDNLTPAQAIALEDMFAVWQIMSGFGASRWTGFFADGDGNFHPKIKVNGEDPKRYTHPVHGKKDWDKYRMDYDEIAWLLHEHKPSDLQEKV